jgi:hypothetical protein
MTRVFISYTAKNAADKQFAHELRNWLEQNGVSTWMDAYNIPPSSNWDAEIDRGLRHADVVLGIMSQASVERDNVKNEWIWAKNQGKLMLVQIQPCDPGHQFTRVQYIDFTGSVPDPYNRLLHAIRIAPVRGKSPPQKQQLSWLDTLKKAILGAPPRRVKPPNAKRGRGRGCIWLAIGLVLSMLLVCGVLYALAANYASYPDYYWDAAPTYRAPSTSNATTARDYLDLILSQGTATTPLANLYTCPHNADGVRTQAATMLTILNLAGVETYSFICTENGSSSVYCPITFTDSYGYSETMTLALGMHNGYVCDLSVY